MKLAAGTGALVAAGGMAGCSVMRRADFGAAPAGERLRRIGRSPNWKDGEFRNLEPLLQLPEVSDADRRMRMLGFFFNNGEGQKPSQPIPSVKTDLSSLPEASLVWLGHSGYCIRDKGLTVLVDPALSQAFPMPGFYRPFEGADIYQPVDMPSRIDVLLITHDHYDHLDCRTVSAIRSRVVSVICPLGVGAHLEAWGYDPRLITELDWNESTKAGCLAVTALPTQHFSGRTFRRNQTLWAGYMLEFPGRTIYISGDGGWGSHFEGIARRWPKIDLAIVEDGQYNPAWAGVHLLPQHWKKVLELLAPAAAMACHNSKFDLSVHLWTDPLNAASRSAAELGIPLLTPRIGERVQLGDVRQFPRWWPEKP